MKTKAINQSFVILLFVILGASCTEKTCIEEPPIIQIDTIYIIDTTYITDTTYIIDTVYLADPALAILGKWEVIKSGISLNNMTNIENPYGYTEYSIDSVMKIFNYSTGRLDMGNYWFEDSYLIHGYYNDEGLPIAVEINDYEFSNNNNTLLTHTLNASGAVYQILNRKE